MRDYTEKNFQSRAELKSKIENPNPILVPRAQRFS